MVGAVLNIQLPLALGSLVNIVSGFQLGRRTSDYLQELINPGLKLLGTHVICVQTIYNIYILISPIYY